MLCIITFCLNCSKFILQSIAEKFDLLPEFVRTLLHGCNGDVSRLVSYIQYGPLSSCKYKTKGSPFFKGTSNNKNVLFSEETLNKGKES